MTAADRQRGRASSTEGDCPDCGSPRAGHVIVWEEVPEGNPNVPYVAYEGDLRFACSADTPSEKKRRDEEAQKRAAEFERAEKVRKAQERAAAKRQRDDRRRRERLLASMGGLVKSCGCERGGPLEPDWDRHDPRCAFYKTGEEKDRKQRERQQKRKKRTVTEEEAQAGLSALFGGREGSQEDA